jgi:hypothetical protein
MWGSGQAFGVATHPFGSAVKDPQSDLRLASFAMNAIDDETGMVQSDSRRLTRPC